jgi:hypothetical protein
MALNCAGGSATTLNSPGTVSAYLDKIEQELDARENSATSEKSVFAMQR